VGQARQPCVPEMRPRDPDAESPDPDDGLVLGLSRHAATRTNRELNQKSERIEGWFSRPTYQEPAIPADFSPRVRRSEAVLGERRP
jgi:hypothetical protein